MDELAIKDRICDATSRIPTSRWPLYATTLDGTIALLSTETTVTFEAERDTLLTQLSIRVIDSVTGVEVTDASVTIDYCNTVYAQQTRTTSWRYCCGRKPVFLMGVREAKRLRITVSVPAAPAVNPVAVEVSLAGFQGEGCCN